MDKYTGYSSLLIPFFAKAKNLVLELKTKVSDIENVLMEKPNENIVISWSINTPEIAKRYEKGSADVDDRIGAALKAAKRGYRVGFHFDPIVFYENWEEDYKNTIETIFSNKEITKKTAWVSLGALRYTPGLKQVSEQRFSDNQMFYEGEFFPDIDGKFRYSVEARQKMFTKISEYIRAVNNKCWIYLCMEPKNMWERTGIDEIGFIG